MIRQNLTEKDRVSTYQNGVTTHTVTQVNCSMSTAIEPLEVSV